jgi:hypothetical protein
VQSAFELSARNKVSNARGNDVSQDSGFLLFVFLDICSKRKDKSSRMELNAATAHVPANFKQPSTGTREERKPKQQRQTMQQVAKELESSALATGLGARSLVALAGREAGPRIGPPSVTAAQLRDARAKVTTTGAFLHPNSWQLYESAPAIVPEKEVIQDEEDDLILLSDE